MSTGTSATADETATTTTVAATISNTGTYMYTLPSGNYAVTTQASHATSSDVVSGNTGSITYSYAPATDFVGTDTVVISPTDSTHHNMQGGCHHGDSTASSKIAFHITVTAAK